MLDTESFLEFKRGLTRMRDDDPDQALVHMRRAVELEAHNPYYISYLGLLLARAERKWREAEELCAAAVRMKRDQAQLYLNLAEVYVAADRRDDAIEALTRGLKNARRDTRLTTALSRLVQRRAPVLRFLARSHFLNRNLGKIRHAALQQLGNA